MAAYTPKFTTPSSKKRWWLRILPGTWGLKRIKSIASLGRVTPGKVRKDMDRKGRNRSRNGLLFVVVGLFCISSGWLGYRLLAASDIFRLTESMVIGNRMLRDRQILDGAGLNQGMNLLGFDVGAAKAGVMELPWVDQAHVQIHWPSRVVVKVQEYHPLALVHYDGNRGLGLYYVDQKGTVFAPVDRGQDVDYPVITGCTAQNGSGGEQGVDHPLFAEAVRFLRFAGGNAILPAQAVSEVHIDSEHGLIVYLVDRVFPIYMGEDLTRTKYNRLVKILERLYRKKQIENIREIRMDYTENKVLVASTGPTG